MSVENETSVSIVMPVKSILAFRKAITSMKDVGSLITLATYGQQSILELSVIDNFESSALTAAIPVRPFFGNVWVNIASEKLNTLASKLKAHPNPLLITLTSKQYAIFTDAVTKEQIMGIFKSHGDAQPKVHPIRACEYYFVDFLSLDLLNILVNLSCGSAIMTLSLRSDGELSFSNKHEYGTTLIQKQLVGFPPPQATQVLTILSKVRCITKFIKMIVNSMVNCSKNNCQLGIPKQTDSPVVLQFLLSHDIYENFLMLPFHAPLRHQFVPGSFQNPIQLVFNHPKQQVQRECGPQQAVCCY
jgi:hypothetical protein